MPPLNNNGLDVDLWTYYETGCLVVLDNGNAQSIGLFFHDVTAATRLHVLLYDVNAAFYILFSPKLRATANEASNFPILVLYTSITIFRS